MAVLTVSLASRLAQGCWGQGAPYGESGPAASDSIQRTERPSRTLYPTIKHI